MFSNFVMKIQNCKQLDEINQLFLPNMRNKLMWFYQEVDDTESNAPQEVKPGPSRATTSNPSKTPQGREDLIFIFFFKITFNLLAKWYQQISSNKFTLYAFFIEIITLIPNEMSIDAKSP